MQTFKFLGPGTTEPFGKLGTGQFKESVPIASLVDPHYRFCTHRWIGHLRTSWFGVDVRRCRLRQPLGAVGAIQSYLS